MRFITGVTPECFNRGFHPASRLDSRYKRSGMTDSKNPVNKSLRSRCEESETAVIER